MKDLRGRLPNFSSNCLQDTSFKIREGSTFSYAHPQAIGVPHGSILSVTLFSVIINSITQFLRPGVDCSLYVDDFQVCYRSSNMSIIERKLQFCLNKLQQWATDNGFQFSKTKPVCMHICQKIGFNLDPQTFSRQKSNSSSGGDHISGGYILETPSYFVLPPWYIKPPKIVLDLVHLKKDHTDESIYQKLFMEIQDRYHVYSCLYRWFTGCATVFPSNTVISMRLPDSEPIFTAEIWAIIKALEEIKYSVASKYFVFTDLLSCLQALKSIKLKYPLVGMVILKCVF